MAFSARPEDEMEEFYDSEEVLEEKVEQLSKWIQEANHLVVFTGAGISTSAGLNDFRGPEGAWTREAKGLDPLPSTLSTEAFPTDCHMALVTLQNAGILKYLISQNCDGLHRRSGMQANMMSELHGNGNVEECESCTRRYFRDWDVDRVFDSEDHFTGRFCSAEGCLGRLLEWTVDFGQDLPEDQLNLAYEHSKKSDLHVCFGSSLTVSPACTMPSTTKKKGGRLVICNLQKTPLSEKSDIHIHARTDVIMSMLLKKLGVDPVPWRIKRKMVVGWKLLDIANPSVEVTSIATTTTTTSTTTSTTTTTTATAATDSQSVVYSALFSANGLDPDNSAVSMTLFSKIEISFPGTDEFQEILEGIPICFSAPKGGTLAAVLRFHFFRHYGEPPLDLDFPLKLDNTSKKRKNIKSFYFIYNPFDGTWQVEKCDLPKLSPIILSFAEKPRPEKLKDLLAQNGMNELNFPNPKEELTESCKSPSINLGENVIWGHSATVVPKYSAKKMFIFGGTDDKQQYSDTWIYDTQKKTTELVNASGQIPPPRAYHTAIARGYELIVFGGASNADDGPFCFYNNVYVLNTKKMEWRCVQVGGHLPKGCCQAALALLKNRYLLVAGGYMSKQHGKQKPRKKARGVQERQKGISVNTLHFLDLNNDTWYKVDSTIGSGPSEILYHPSKYLIPYSRCFLIPVTDSAFLFYGPSGASYLEVTRWEWTPCLL